MSTFLPQEALAGRCTGAADCTACTNCKYCKHCSKNGGSCGVCNSWMKKEMNAHEEKSLLSNPISYYLYGAGSFGGLFLLYRGVKKKKK